MTLLGAVILAGGRSKRMGQDKALLSLGGENLLQRTCRIALGCTPQVEVITPWPERYQAMVPEMVKLRLEVPLPGQSETFQGPLVALAQVLNKLQREGWAQENPLAWVMVLACDLPNLSLSLLQGWIADLRDTGADTLVCLPRRQGRWEPLCGFYRLHCGPSLWQYSQAGGRSLQPWLRQQSVVQLPLADSTLLMNLNTPEDLKSWHAQVSTHPE